MDTFKYSTLEEKYNQFADPVANIIVNEHDLSDNSSGVAVSDVNVELTCGFEAGQASFSLYDCYDPIKSEFQYSKLKDYIMLGSPITVSLGYYPNVREVFRGIVTRVEFVIDDSDAPHARVTAMDIKAIMMSNRYHKSLTATTYSGAVNEIFMQDVYMEMRNPTGVITSLTVSDTPDTLEIDDSLETDKTIEMVGESDYAFIVRAAKRFNFEFYCIGGQVVFRSARADSSNLLTFDNTAKIFNMDVSYEMTGLVGAVTVRGLDVGKMKTVENTIRNNSTISEKSYAKKIIKGSTYVYVDPTVQSKSEARYRSWYLYDDMSFRFGHLDLEVMGLPEIIPGRFISVANFGQGVSNTFYVTEVHHRLDRNGRYTSRVIGKAQQLQNDLFSMLE